MADTVMSDREQVSRALTRINDAGFGCELDQLADLLDDGVVMVLPGFEGRAEGKEAMLGGFQDFCQNARIMDFSESDRQVDVVGDVAVASFRFEVSYERGGDSYRSAGRDMWVFAKNGGKWKAVWRTMLDLSETSLGGSE